MNKKAIAALCIVAGIGTAAALVLNSAKGRMEDAARRALSEIAGQEMKSSFLSVSASPLSGGIEVKGWTIKNAKGQPQARVKSLEARLSDGMRRTFLPFGGGADAIREKDGLADVFSRIDLYGIENTDADMPVKAAAVHISRLQMRRALAADFLAGKKPSRLDMAMGTAAGTLSVEKVRIGEGGSAAALQELKIDGLRGASAKRISLEGAEARNGGRRTFSMKSFSLDFFKIPETVVRKAAKLAEGGGDASPADMLGILAEIKKHGPVFSRLAIEGVAAAPDEGTPDVLLAKGEFVWRSFDPFASESRMQGLKVPVAAIDGVRLRGIDAIEVDAESQSAGALGENFPFAVGRMEDSGVVDIKKLARIQYKCAMEGMGGLTELSLSLEDKGLAAQAAVLLGDDAAGVREAALELCSKDAPEDAQSCAAIASFIDRPGRITFTLREDAFGIDAAGIAERVFGKFGSIFNAAALPGHRSLAEQIAALPPASAEPAKAPAEAGK